MCDLHLFRDKDGAQRGSLAQARISECWRTYLPVSPRRLTAYMRGWRVPSGIESRKSRHAIEIEVPARRQPASTLTMQPSVGSASIPMRVFPDDRLSKYSGMGMASTRTSKTMLSEVWTTRWFDRGDAETIALPCQVEIPVGRYWDARHPRHERRTPPEADDQDEEDPGKPYGGAFLVDAEILAQEESLINVVEET